MRNIFFALLVLSLLLLCCKHTPELIDTMNVDNTSIAKVLGHKVIDNKTITIKFSETVEIVDLEFNREKVDYHNIASTFTIKLPKPLKRGEKAILSVTAKKMNGNTTRASFILIGENHDIPSMLINELSIAGNKQNPDRIELAVLENGNVAGVTVSNKYKNQNAHQFSLPELDVCKGDMIVIYWDKKPDKNQEKRKNGRMTYYFAANSTSTLSSTKGVVVLMENPQGALMDAVIYNDDFSESNLGFGSEALLEQAKLIITKDQWSETAVDSSQVTSSRVLARLPGYMDSNSADDWFTTIARGSTFGDENLHTPYIEE